jgi:competence protein ComK
VSILTKDHIKPTDKLLLVQPTTLMLKPVQYGESTWIYVSDKKPVLINKKALTIIQKSCLHHLSTYDGRREASKQMLGVKSKLPVVIDSIDGTYLFPISSHLKPDCVWIALSHVKELKIIDKKKTEVLFKDGQKVMVNASLLVVFSQLELANELRKRTKIMTFSGITEKAARKKWVNGKKRMIISFLDQKEREQEKDSKR